MEVLCPQNAHTFNAWRFSIFFMEDHVIFKGKFPRILHHFFLIQTNHPTYEITSPRCTHFHISTKIGPHENKWFHSNWNYFLILHTLYIFKNSLLDSNSNFFNAYIAQYVFESLLLSHYLPIIKQYSPSASSPLIISWSSASVGFCPRALITVPRYLVLIDPSPSLSNRLNASFSSAWQTKHKFQNHTLFT